MSTEDRGALEARQAVFREAVTSLETVRPTLPNTEVDDVRTVRVGDLDVRVQYLGPGHTAGDLVVHVPARNVVVVGDLITAPVPAAAESFPVEWVGVLDRLDALEWAQLVPGHGTVQGNRDYLHTVSALLQDLLAYVRTGVQASTEVDELVAAADFSNFRIRLVGDDARGAAMFQGFFVEPGIRSAYAQLTGR